MLYPTRKSAKANRHHGERIVPVYSETDRCKLGCFCIRVPKRLVGYALILHEGPA
jgi:hypothetical protein